MEPLSLNPKWTDEVFYDVYGMILMDILYGDLGPEEYNYFDLHIHSLGDH